MIIVAAADSDLNCAMYLEAMKHCGGSVSTNRPSMSDRE